MIKKIRVLWIYALISLHVASADDKSFDLISDNVKTGVYNKLEIINMSPLAIEAPMPITPEQLKARFTCKYLAYDIQRSESIFKLLQDIKLGGKGDLSMIDCRWGFIFYGSKWFNQADIMPKKARRQPTGLKTNPGAASWYSRSH